MKRNILDYVDDAIEYGHHCFSKRGRPKLLNRRGKKGKRSTRPPIKIVPEEIPIIKKERNIMDTAESATAELMMAENVPLELNLSFSELSKVNESLANLHAEDRMVSNDALF